MAQHGDDCYFFYSASCIKGAACPFRHVEAARGSEVECPQWRQGHCFQPNCPNRHAEIVKNRHMIPCFYESQPGGCTKPMCPFLHSQPKLNVPPPAFSGPPPVRPQVSGPQQAAGAHPVAVRPQVSAPHPGLPGQAPGPHAGPPRSVGPPPGSQPMAPHPAVSGPRPVLQQVRPQGPPGMAHPPPHFWRGPPGPQGLPVFQALPPGPRPPMFRPEEGVRLIMVPTVEPVIVNVNSEESESDASPVKPIRVVAPHIRKSMSDTTLIHQEAPPDVRPENNPLDYFLGAKPWVDPNPHEWDNRRSPSPLGRQFQARRSGSISPRRVRGSLSPENSRRSTSGERRIRPVERRRSHSLDRSRSQSPDWPGRVRRRSPGRPRSRSPIGRRPFRGPPARRSPPRRFGRSLQRPQDRRPRRSPPKEKPPVQPLIVPTGRKIISTKKEKNDEEKKEQAEDGEEKEGTEETKEGEETGEGGVAEVRSLEDIYREKALKSLMEAKKKKVIENRRQKLAERAKLVKTEHPELVKSDENADERKSDKSSGSEQTSESENEASGDEKEANSSEEDVAKTEGGAKGESANEEEEKVESDIDLAEDVDIEIEAGDRGSEEENSGSEGSDEHEEEHSDREEHKSDDSEKEQKVVEKRKKVAKSNIKSRLGVKSEVLSVQAKERKERKERIQARIALNAPKPSIKDRLGKREPEKSNVRSGVIKLNTGRIRDVQEPLQDIRTSRIGRITDYGREKDIMMVPKIVVRNRLQDFDPDYENSQESTRSRYSYDDYDSYSDYSQDSDSDDTISKLTKRKKKLKKMLESEGSEYDDIELLKREQRKIKKLLKRKKEKKKEEKRRKKERRRRERKEREYSEEEEDLEEKEDKNQRRIKIQSRLGPAKDEKSADEGGDQNEEELEEVDLSEEDHLELEEGRKNGEKVEEKPVLTEEEKADRERLRQEKAQRLQEALQPKSLEDIRRERAQKKVLEPRVAVKEKKPEGPGRRIMLAEDKEPSPPKQQVRITFNEESKPPVRQRIRLKRDAEQNENTVPSVNAVKRERQIYLPPGRKKPVKTITPEVLWMTRCTVARGRRPRATVHRVIHSTEGVIVLTVEQKGEPDTEPATKKTVSDREIVDYGELFPSQPGTTARQTEQTKPTTIQLVRHERKPPPKVEVENAGIKSFAEIMAEKKRKRLLAQQESKKNITPIVFEDRPDSRSSVTGRLTPDLRSRLSPVDGSISSAITPSESSTKSLKISQTSAVSSSAETDSSVKTDTIGVKPNTTLNSSQPRTSSPVAIDTGGLKRTLTPSKMVSKELSTQKPNRWKRRKGNTENEESVGVSSSMESLTVKTSESATDIPKLEEDIALSPVPAVSEKARRVSTASEKKSAKASDSLMDFEDELLADVDLNLDDEKSHDELMREMEELLA